MPRFDNVRVSREFKETDPYADKDAPETISVDPDDKRDEDTEKKVLSNLRKWWDRERLIQSENRLEMAIDCDYYDGLQWTQEEIEELRNRRQAPLVYNKIKQAVDWIIGTEKRMKMDFRCYPRRGDQVESSNAKTELLKYLSDVNRCGFHRSKAFSDTVRSGLGWLEDGVRNDESDELIFSRREDWRNIWYDSNSIEPDLSDARYLFRAKWVDLDYAQAMFPARRKELKDAAVSHDIFEGEEEEFLYNQLYQTRDEYGRVQGRSNYLGDSFNTDNTRERVRLIECWYRVPQEITRIHGPIAALEGVEFDGENMEHVELLDEDIISTYDATVMKMWCAMFTADLLLQNMPSPYRHNQFPFTPIWGYRRTRDNAPYGQVRNARDPQSDLNKRASKSLFILSTNQVVMDKGAVDDLDVLEEQANDPSGIIEKNPGKEFELNRDTRVAQEHLDLMDRDEKYIEYTTGVSGENLARETNAESGKAILAKQNEGSVVTAELYDNLRFALQMQGEKRLSLVEQYYSEEKVIRILGDRGKAKFVTLNEPTMEIDPLTGMIVYKNDITASKADFIVDEQDFRENLRMMVVDQLFELMAKLGPEIALQIAHEVVDMMDIPGKDDLKALIMKINGQTDLSESSDPEEVAEAQRIQQSQQEQADLERRAAEADIRAKETKADLTEQQARRAEEERRKIRSDTHEKAIQNASQLATLPQLGPMADELTRE
jgi:hypothetical protein